MKRRDLRMERESETRDLRAASMAERWRDGSRAPDGSKMAYAITGSGGKRMMDASKGDSREICGGSWANESEPVLSTVGVPFVVIGLTLCPPVAVVCGGEQPHPDRRLPTIRHGVVFLIRHGRFSLSPPELSQGPSCKEALGQHQLPTDLRALQLPASSIRSTHRLKCSTQSMGVSFVLPTSGDAYPPSMTWREMSTRLPLYTREILAFLVRASPFLSAPVQPIDQSTKESSSLERINDRTLRHLTMYSPLIPAAQRNHLLAPENLPSTIRSTVNISMLSEFPLLLSGQIKLQIPVYTVWGACEDIIVVEKFRTGTYDIENLHLLDEATTRCLDLGGIKLRLLGLGGALVPHKMFDNGDGNATIAGGQGTMWTTALQIGELVDTAQRVHDHTETRLLVTHASPGREGMIAQLALVLRADLTISAGLHFRYASSYNEFSVQGDFQGFRSKLLLGKENFDRVWESVKNQVDAVIDEHQRVLLDKALSVIDRIPSQNSAAANPAIPPEDPAWKNCWNWNLCDAAYGSLVLDIKDGRVSAELKSQGECPPGWLLVSY